MSLPEKIKSVWTSAELLIAFHRAPDGKKRDKPSFWSPKNAFARIFERPKEQQAFVTVKGQGGMRDVQIAFQQSRIVAKREAGLGWEGIELKDEFVRIFVNGRSILIKPDGGVSIEEGEDKTHLDADGSIWRLLDDAEITVSPDGENISRRTEDRITVVTEDGVLSKRH
jgi:hypothetical protein